MSMVTLNEMYQLGIKDKEAFLEPLASNIMQPAYCDSTTVQMQRVLSYVDRMRFTGTHLSSATYFLLNVITYDLTGW